MKVLVIGSGGREHTLCWALSSSKQVEKVYCAPGSEGMHPDAEPVNAKVSDLSGLANLARERSIDLTVVGPEVPLCDGIVDHFQSAGLTTFGPTAKAAQLEGSKVFSKEFMARHGIPTAEFGVFDTLDPALEYVRASSKELVVKADGLAAGKGVIVCDTPDEAEAALKMIIVDRAFGEAGDRVVVEERLRGEEASYMVLCDGERVLPLASSQDHKQVFDGDKGPNTGGMGAYSPAPIVTSEMEARIMEEVILPVVKGMAAEGTPCRGVIYAGVMIVEGRPSVLEFNCRFGDPEAQPVLFRQKDDLAEILKAAAKGRLPDRPLAYESRPAVCVVMASGGYPGSYEKGKPITGLEDADRMEDVKVFAAGVNRTPDGRVVTAGGRVLGVTALGQDLAGAKKRAYEAVAKISWDGAHYRKDIADKGIRRL